MNNNNWETIRTYKGISDGSYHHIITDDISIRWYYGKVVDASKSHDISVFSDQFIKMKLLMKNDPNNSLVELYGEILGYMQVKQRELNFKLLNE